MAYFEDRGMFLEPNNVLDFSNKTSGENGINNLWTGDSITSCIRIICILLLRGGFILVQVGSIPVENAYMIIFRNIIEIAVTIFSYGFIGFYLSFGKKSFHGIINYDGYIGNKDADLSAAALGFSSCLLGTAITSSMLVARLHQVPMLIVTFISSAFLLPTLMCWCWSDFGWMMKLAIFDQRVAVKDFGGNLVIHAPSAAIGLLGALFLGRRIMKLKDIDRFSLGHEYTSGIVTGYFLIIAGHIGFNMPSNAYESKHMLNDYISRVSINSLMAMGAGILVVTLILVILTRDIYRYWIIVKSLQGGLAGIVTVAAGIDIYTPGVNFGIACGGGMIFFLFSNLIHFSALEDCCNIITIYLICGSVGSLIPPLLGSGENLGLTGPVRIQFIHLLWQFICLIVILLMTVIIYLSLFTILFASGILKNTYEEANHQRAKILYGRLPWKKYFDRLFMINGASKEISPESNRNEMNKTFTSV
uniref:Ammonium transporter AmtB-like domain-containing protein n=1 Tax=Dendroctonus ponderosae TaxID=77166 RepID=A0AAR5P1X6_DENPD